MHGRHGHEGDALNLTGITGDSGLGRDWYEGQALNATEQGILGYGRHREKG